jgi:hypothetical protein
VWKNVPVDRQLRHMQDAHVRRGRDEIGRALLHPVCQSSRLWGYAVRLNLVDAGAKSIA